MIVLTSTGWPCHTQDKVDDPTASQSQKPIRNTKRFNRPTRSVCLRGDPARMGRAWATLPNHSHRVKLLHVYTAPVCFRHPSFAPLPCRCPRSARYSKLWGGRVPPTGNNPCQQDTGECLLRAAELLMRVSLRVRLTQPPKRPLLLHVRAVWAW